MELTAIIASVDELERRIAVALAEEDYDSARALGEEVATLIRQIGARAATATAEEAAQLSKEELRQRINTALSFNDWDWQEARRIPFHGRKSGKKLSRTLYMCPVCRAEGAMRGTVLRCARR